MPFDFKGFKKVSKGATHTIFEHPDGHIIHVAHQGLDSEQSKDMAAIPVQKFDVGGDVQQMSTPADGSQPAPEQSWMDKLAPAAFGAVNTISPMVGAGILAGKKAVQNFSDSSAPSDPTLGLAPSNQPLPQAQPQGNNGDMFGSAESFRNASQGANNYMAGIQGAAQAEGDLGKNVAGIREGQATQAAQDDADEQEHTQNYLQESQNMRAEIANGTIDPRQYINSMSTGSKIMTGIGLMLGGLGSGGDPEKNPALAMLQKNIDRDIDAQKSNLDTKKGLLSSLHQEHGDYMSAMTHHRAISNEMIGAQIEAAANQMQDPIKKAQALQLAGKFQFDSAQQLGHLQMMKNMQAQMKSGQGNPAMMLHMLPKEDQASATKELEKVDQTGKLRTMYEQSFKDLSGKFLAGMLSPSDKQSAIESIAGNIEHLTEGRFQRDQAIAQAHAILPSPGESQATRDMKLKRGRQLLDTMSNTPTLDKWGIKPKAKVSGSGFNSGK